MISSLLPPRLRGGWGEVSPPGTELVEVHHPALHPKSGLPDFGAKLVEIGNSRFLLDGEGKRTPVAGARCQATPREKRPAGCGPFASAITDRMAPQASHRAIETRPRASPFHHTVNAANDSSVTTVSGSAMVSFCSTTGQNMNARPAKIEARH